MEFVRNEIEVYYGEDNIPDEVFTNIPIEDVISEIEKTPIPPQPPPSGGGTTMADIKTETPVVEETPVEDEPETETPIIETPVVETPPPKSNNSGIHSITVHDQQYISVSNSYPYQAPGQAWEMKNEEGTLYLIVGSSATYTKSLAHEHNDGDIGPHHHHDDNINHGGNHEIHNHGNNYDSYHIDQYTHKHTYEVPQIDERISFPNADYLFVENHQMLAEAGNPWSFTFLPSEPGQAMGITRPVDTDYITVSGGGKTVKIIAP